jgi:hypothetical protein
MPWIYVLIVSIRHRVWCEKGQFGQNCPSGVFSIKICNLYIPLVLFKKYQTLNSVILTENGSASSAQTGTPVF